MPTIPTTHNAQIAWFEQRISDWIAQAENIGLTPEQLVALNPLITTARTDYDAAQAARQASKSSTMTANDSRGAMREFGGDLVKTIQAYAEASGDRSVYALAQIPAPAEPSPIGPPAVPSDIKGALNSNGSITLRWAGTREGGTVWMVQRQTADTVNGPYTDWALLESVSERTFNDITLPAGVAKAAYRIKAQRSPGGTSDWSETFTMSLGVVPQSGEQNEGNSGLSLAA